MCYDVSIMTHRAERYAKRRGQASMWEEASKKNAPIYHTSGFFEPDVPVFTNEEPEVVHFHHWPFVPIVYAPEITNKRTGRKSKMNTLNAKGEKIFDKKSYYHKAATNRRCLVMIDGFFEHHTLKNGVKIPHYIKLHSGDPFCIGGVWQQFTSKKDEVTIQTVSLITTTPNKEMKWIHNQPAYSPTPRMPFFVDPKDDDQWLHGSPEEAASLIKPLPDDSLSYHPCEPIKSNKKLRREYIGNVPEIQNRRHYPELDETQGGLF